MIILAFSGLTLLLAVLSAVFGWPLALGAAAVAGGCAVWAALMSTTGAESSPAPAAPSLEPASAAPQSAVPAGSDPAVVVVVQPAVATPRSSDSHAEMPAVAEAPPTLEPVVTEAEAPVAPPATQAPATPPSRRR